VISKHPEVTETLATIFNTGMCHLTLTMIDVIVL